MRKLGHVEANITSDAGPLDDNLMASWLDIPGIVSQQNGPNNERIVAGFLTCAGQQSGLCSMIQLTANH